MLAAAPSMHRALVRWPIHKEAYSAGASTTAPDANRCKPTNRGVLWRIAPLSNDLAIVVLSLILPQL